MDRSIEALIQSKWQDEQLPIIDGILFDTGKIILLDYEAVIIEPFHERVKIKEVTALSLWLEKNPDMWAYVTELSSITDALTGLKILCGEGSWGGDGFVAVCEAHSNYLKWGAFFRDSNPFVRIKINDSTAVAITNHNQTWSFPILNPESIVKAPPSPIL